MSKKLCSAIQTSEVVNAFGVVRST